jgi:hypothetical protein
MHRKKLTAFALISLVAVWFLAMGCDEDSSYDSRTVVYVASVNENAPFISDVLNQGDSVRTESGAGFVTNDDFVEEDFIQIVFHNRPYNGLVNACGGSLGDFLVTHYSVEFVPYGSDPVPVPAFSGETSILVPANSMIEGYILLVPIYAKQVSPLVDMQYTAQEIMTVANITFSGHEVQTERVVEFSCGVSVNFADPLEEEDEF